MSAGASSNKYRLEVDGRIIRNHAVGAVDKQTMEAFSREMNALVERFDGRPYGVYSKFGPEVLLDADAEKRQIDSLSERRKHGMVGLALNLTDVPKPLLVKAQYRRIGDKAGLPIEAFDDDDRAVAWLRGMIDAIEKERAGPESSASSDDHTLKLEIDGRIIKNNMTGPANVERVRHFAKEMNARVSAMQGQPFGVYSEFGPEFLLTPDAENSLRESLEDRMSRGMVAVALNLSRTRDRQRVQSQIGGICDDIGLSWRTFADYQPAKEWLAREIFEADSHADDGGAVEFHLSEAPIEKGFQPHGDYSIHSDNRIIKIAATGSVNRESMQRYTREMNALVESFGGQPFAVYSVYGPDVLLTHEAEERLRANLLERMEHGMCAAALNLSNSTHRLIVSAQIGGLYDEIGLPWKLCEGYEEVRGWLLEKIREAEQSA